MKKLVHVLVFVPCLTRNSWINDAFRAPVVRKAIPIVTGFEAFADAIATLAAADFEGQRNRFHTAVAPAEPINTWTKTAIDGLFCHLKQINLIFNHPIYWMKNTKMFKYTNCHVGS